MTIRVLIVDDHPMFRFGLAAALGGADAIEVVGEAADGAEALRFCATREIDVVLSDIEMPGTDGLDLVAALAAKQPELPVLLLTMHDDLDGIRAALAAGARGYVLKGAGRDEIVRAIRTVHEGGVVYGAGVADRVQSLLTRTAPSEPLPGLTPRERDVLTLVARGLGNHAIAGQLHLSEKTVRNHVSNLLVKLGVATRAAAVAAARDAGL